jgi:chitodextrinase
MPKPGDEYCISRTNLTFYPVIYQTGANQTWDFRNIIPLSQDSLFYEAGLQTPYAANPLLWPILFSRFGRPTTNIPTVVNDLLQENIGFSVTDQYLFYDNNTNTRFRNNARGFTIGGIPLALPYTNPDDVLTFPYTYLSTHQDSFAYTIGIPTQAGVKIRGQRSSVCNGWGTVILRTDTFQALRIEHTITSVYDISDFTDTFNVQIPVTTVEVEWYAPEVGHPLAVATGLDLFGTTVIYEFAFQDTDRLPLPEFVARGATVGCRPLTVEFQNQSQRAWTYQWNFGDGTTSTEANPTHTYAHAGTYTVTLTATNWLGSRTRTRQNYIVVKGPNAAFAQQPAGSVGVQQPVHFANATTGGTPPLTYYWLFGDGIGSTLASPTHYYLQPGTHTATLIVTDAEGCADTLTRAVVVTAPSGQQPEANTLDRWLLYPNPVPESVLMLVPPAGTTGPVGLELTDLQGRRLWLANATATASTPLRIELPSHLPAGLYALKATASAASHTFRVVLAH